MNLLEFYNKVLTSVNFTVNEDNEVLYNDEKETPLKILKIPVVMPIKENVTTMLNQNGTPCKIIFNPLMEDVYSRKQQGNKILTKLITSGKMKLTISLLAMSRLLLGAVDKKQTSYNTTSFITLLNKTIDNPAIKKIVDEKSLAVVYNILESSILTEIEPIRFIQTRNTKANGPEKYSVVTSVYSPLLDYILEEEKEGKIESINGITVRKKEIDSIKAIIKFMLQFTDLNVLKLGSSNNQPGFTSFMLLYLALATHFNEMAEDLRKIDLEAYDEAKINLQLTIEDLDNIEELQNEAKLYPSESGTIGNIKEETPIVEQQTPVNNNPLLNKINEVQHRKVNYVTAPVVENNMSEYERAKMALNHGTPPVTNEVPSLANYNGPRPDLHVANIYNQAQPYNNPLLVQPQNNYNQGYTQMQRPSLGQPQVNNYQQPVNYYNGNTNQSRLATEHVSFQDKLAMSRANENTNPYLGGGRPRLY